MSQNTVRQNFAFFFSHCSKTTNGFYEQLLKFYQFCRNSNSLKIFRNIREVLKFGEKSNRKSPFFKSYISTNPALPPRPPYAAPQGPQSDPPSGGTKIAVCFSGSAVPFARSRAFSMPSHLGAPQARRTKAPRSALQREGSG